VNVVTLEPCFQFSIFISTIDFLFCQLHALV
jgi:hypothetical protein